MTFLNGVLAFGAAAFSIPLLIHLLNRSRFRKVPWGAMHLLESLVRTNQRRLQFEQLLLLLIRCAIPVLLALSLARPVLTSWRVLPGATASSLMIVVDDSYSMNTVDGADGPKQRFPRAVEACRTLVKALPNGSDVAALRSGDGPVALTAEPTSDTGSIGVLLQQLHADYGASRMVPVLERAASTVAGMNQARRDLVIVSDFQKADWTALTDTVLRDLQTKMTTGPSAPHISLLPVGRPTDNNVSVDAATLTPAILGVNQELRIRARVRNHGPQSYSAAAFVMTIDGTSRATQQIALGAHAAADVLFTYRFSTPGTHLVQVTTALSDSLADDNQYVVSVPVWDRIPVLLVDGAPGTQPLAGETDFLAVALTPFTMGRTQLSDLVETRICKPADVGESALADVRVVVMANVARLGQPQTDALTGYVRNGGTLLVFVGNRVDIEWYNSVLAGAANGLLPATIVPATAQSTAAAATHIVAQRFDAPALEFFNDRANGDLSTAEIRKWYRLVPITAAAGDRPGNSPATAAGVMASFANGDPFLVQRRVGDGLVVLAATACDTDWSNLPLRPVYVPLMQQLVTTLAGHTQPPVNVETGQPLLAMLPGKVADLAMAMTLPDRTQRTVRATPFGTHAVVRFTATRQPGPYTLNGPAMAPWHFVARTGRAESVPELLSRDELQQLAQRLGGTVVESAADYLERDRQRRYGREIWRPLLYCVFGLLFLEVILQQRFARVRP